MVLEEITAAIILAGDLVLGPVKIFQPHVSLAILSIALTVIVLILGRLVTNRKFIAEIKARTEDLRVKLAQAQKEGNKDGTNQLLNELMKTQSQYMKHNFRILIVSMVMISLFLPWANHTYQGTSVAVLPFELPVIGASLSWIYWYILISFTVSWVIRKLFGFE